jgi:serine/threonine protein phosphatase 1
MDLMYKSSTKYSSSLQRSLNSKIPEGERVYAIGDIHGRLDLLNGVLAKIDADLAARPIAVAHEVFLGDFIDRGPRSREVVDTIMMRLKCPNRIALSGNHEEIILRAAKDPAVFLDWLQYGGREALASYGIYLPRHLDDDAIREAMAAMRDKIPAAHFAFFENLPAMHIIGDYVFVHAGLKPGVALEHQTRRDVMWIRQEFLSYHSPFPMRVVHGHTPALKPEILANRINIDTGAYVTGKLTCLVLQGTTASLL